MQDYEDRPHILFFGPLLAHLETSQDFFLFMSCLRCVRKSIRIYGESELVRFHPQDNLRN